MFLKYLNKYEGDLDKTSQKVKSKLIKFMPLENRIDITNAVGQAFESLIGTKIIEQVPYREMPPHQKHMYFKGCTRIYRER